MAKRLMLATVAAVAYVSAGCSGSGSTAGEGIGGGPHGGVVVALPGDAGVAEVLTEDAATKGPAAARRVPKAVVVYFLGPDKKTALSPAPTGVGVKILGAESAGVITLGPPRTRRTPRGPAASRRRWGTTISAAGARS